MIYSVTVDNGLDSPTLIELANPYDHGINITNITGIGPGVANVTQVEMATMDGSTPTSARMPSRNIVMDIKPMFAPTIEDTRLRIYRLFRLKKYVTLYFKTDRREAHITGIVDKVEPSIFQEDTTIQVSIICGDPYFKSNSKMTTTFSGVDPLFEFPLENDTEEPQLIFGEIKDYTEENIFYEGDADVGMIIHISITGTVNKDIVVHNVANRETMTIKSGSMGSAYGYLVSGDEVILSTIKGDKYMRLLRQGVTYDILNFLDRDVDWIQLKPGDNIITYVADNVTDYLLVTMENDVLYMGI